MQALIARVNECGELPVKFLAKPSYKRHTCPEVLLDLFECLRFQIVEAVEVEDSVRLCCNLSAGT
jgi:hypothetical protein